MRLTGKRALVTGGARGIGRAIAAAFVSEGADVAVCDIDGAAATLTADEIKRQCNGRAHGFTMDVGERASVLACVGECLAALGAIDILVNNAGISKVTPFLEMPESLWDNTLRVNLKGVYLCCQAVLPGMVAAGKGKIINISSQSGKRGNSQYAAYCASKFGVIGLTQSLAQEFAESGITVNAICPGVVFTELWQSPDMLGAYARKRGLAPEAVERYFESKIPLRRLCTVEDVARAAVFLASDESAYMTGQSLNVSGGLEMS
ncbi:MAG TPA: SDR family NAD(P)-dependent oxidoreductase [Candidatus Hydrogenedentes bacterium]|nr:SDR family NAD(P)-dependent oxidoreductase [Candidatus Hydrogenedentota bacterium]